MARRTTAIRGLLMAAGFRHTTNQDQADSGWEVWERLDEGQTEPLAVCAIPTPYGKWGSWYSKPCPVFGCAAHWQCAGDRETAEAALRAAAARLVRLPKSVQVGTVLVPTRPRRAS